jgi:serine/threonine protein kinase
MEFCSGGSCSDLMRPGMIPEDYIMIILRELLLGLDYLHSDKKLHRDVKGAILLNASSQIPAPFSFPFVILVCILSLPQPPIFFSVQMAK